MLIYPAHSLADLQQPPVSCSSGPIGGRLIVNSKHLSGSTGRPVLYIRQVFPDFFGS